MSSANRRFRLPSALAVALFSVLTIAATARYLLAQSSSTPTPAALQASFDQIAKPFFKQNCVSCHNSDLSTAGVRVDELDAKLEDRQLQTWEAIKRRLQAGSMPPKGMPQPAAADRQQMVAWITQALEAARLRPAPNNGLVRRMTISQYKNTLQELLQLEDDLTVGLPPDAVSKDGFLNNKDTLQMSPVLTESYFEIAEEALNRAIIDPTKKPTIQNFRVDLGANVNKAPIPDKLVLGAGSALLDNSDVLVTQLVPKKPFPFDPFIMRTKWRFIEGYQGNDTVRGWREFDSIYHNVFADMRGSPGYPKGEAHSTAPEGLLLRPAIPSDETYGVDSTYGPKANFKISLRELPEFGRFRVTVTAAKYNDGLLLDPADAPQPEGIEGSAVYRQVKTEQTATIPKAGIYQVDVHPVTEPPPPVPDVSRLKEGLTGYWPLDGDVAGERKGKTKFIDSPFGTVLSFSGPDDSVVIPRSEAMNVGDGDFTVTTWVYPNQPRKAGIISLGGDGGPGWNISVETRGAIHILAVGPDNKPAGSITSPLNAVRPDGWYHVAVVVRRGKITEGGKNLTRIFVNGIPSGNGGTIDAANLDNPKADLVIGRVSEGLPFQGEMKDLRIYRRALDEGEILGLVQPGKDKDLVKPPQKRPDIVTLSLGDRKFSGTLDKPAFVAVRLEAGPLKFAVKNSGTKVLDRVVITPLSGNDPVSKRFLAFEKRLPRLGVYLGLRRDCGSTFARVQSPQTVTSEKPAPYVFEGTLRNFPSPQTDKEDNPNYLEGMHEIGVRSEYTDGRDMPRLAIRSVEFEGPYYDQWPPQPYKNIFVDFDRKNDLPAYAGRIIQNFATKAYRRPVTPAEQAMLMGVYRKSFASGENFTDSVKDALLVVLTSPQFLFLVETSKSPANEPLDNYELASKLSYFLWNGPPDRKTLQMAAAGTLTKQEDAEVARMIADPKFSRFTNEFVSEWLSLDKFQVLEVDRKKFPKLVSGTRDQLKQEPVEFVQYLIRNNLPVKNLIESDFVVANETVANYYDLGDKTEGGFQFVPIPNNRPDLGGLLTMPAILAGLSDGRESNPVKRGAWIARKIIAEPPPNPPPNVPALKEATKDLTLRQRLEQHRTQPACNQCHAKIDPWGVPFEEYDAGGRLKKQPVDASSTLPDKTEVSGVNALRKYLANDRIDQVAFSFLKHLETYAIGRSLTYNELNHLKQDELRLKAGGYRMQDMVRYVTDSKLFLEK
jgi:mono/diheme cytochrome c family protein